MTGCILIKTKIAVFKKNMQRTCSNLLHSSMDGNFYTIFAPDQNMPSEIFWKLCITIFLTAIKFLCVVCSNLVHYYYQVKIFNLKVPFFYDMMLCTQILTF